MASVPKLNQPPEQPERHFGGAGLMPNWQRAPVDVADLLDDDRELPQTPQHVIELLGFDPKAAEDEGVDSGEA